MMDKGFERARKALEHHSKQKEFRQKGKGKKPNASVALSEDEVKLLNEKELLGTSSRETLLNMVDYLLRPSWLQRTPRYVMGRRKTTRECE
jgi:hypothetical protein